MASISSPKYIRNIELKINEKLLTLRKPNSEIYETQQIYYDKILDIYQEAFQSIIDSTITQSSVLREIKKAYEDALQVRNQRISQFIIQDEVFGISVRKKQRDDKMRNLLRENDELKEQNLKLTFEISKLKKDMGKLKDDNFTEYLNLMRERDARYTLYFENLGLQTKLKELDGSSYVVDQAYGDPVVLRIALDKCRELLSVTQTELTKKKEEYAETVPRREYDTLEARHSDLTKTLEAVRSELHAQKETYNKLLEDKKSVDEELFECKERVSELDRAGTPRPQWEICADFIKGGRDRWWQLASGLSSRDILRVLLKELGPAAESDHLEYFDGLGTDPMIPPYLRYEGNVRNLRLSRREICIIINDIWRGKGEHRDITMQEYLTHYFEDRYQQASMRAEWAYNLCAGAEQLLDDISVRVCKGGTIDSGYAHITEDIIWAGAARGAIDERVYWGLREHWTGLRDALLATDKHKETITLEDFEKVTKATFPLKSDVDIKNLSDVVRKQLKLKLNHNEVNLEKLFEENEEGFERSELGRELFRQRQVAQDKYIREVLATLGGGARRADKEVTVDALKRAFAIVDPAIDHIRMERYIRWAFSAPSSELSALPPLTLRTMAARLTAGDIERVGPRYTTSRKYKR